ncbi:MAG TPA: DNA-formamidopyrimidine glycosylase family protein [Candidatus Limnocylindria bacterium]|nr:DNA-formamidopyrimidine glycosylase family protein [Candidatus Limnocylindria bacterium]
MPEGDTIARAAAALRLALAGRTVTAFRSTSPGVGPAGERALVGSVVRDVTSKGKHLLMTFDAPGNAMVLHSHMGMTGSWHIYRPGERWRAPSRDVRAVVQTDACVAPCFAAPLIELIRERDLAMHPVLSALGPDAAADGFDEREAVARLRARADVEIGTALLDQRAMAGLGNDLRVEVLHRARVSPFRRVGDLPDDALVSLVRDGRRLLRLNLTGPARRSRNALDVRRRKWVYGRAGKPCYACGTPILAHPQGEQARVAYWCPTCQT